MSCLRIRMSLEDVTLLLLKTQSLGERLEKTLALAATVTEYSDVRGFPPKSLRRIKRLSRAAKILESVCQELLADMRKMLEKE